MKSRRGRYAKVALALCCSLALYGLLGGHLGLWRAVRRSAACDAKRLSSINDSDTKILDTCRFPVISLDKQLDDDINDLKKVSLPFLKNYKNPCWYERLPDDESLLYREHVQMFKEQASRSYDAVIPIMRDRIASRRLWRLRCLPLVYVIGVAKCGTTDLSVHFKNHPFIVKPATKEPMFWSFTRWNFGARFSDYLDLFDEAAEKIRKSTERRSVQNKTYFYHPKITVDMSVVTLFRFDGTFTHFRDNSDPQGPKHVAPRLIKNLTPQAKIILLVRNPTERLYSEYVFFNNGRNTSSTEFHELAVEAVNRMASCLSRHSTRYCIYDYEAREHKMWVRLVAGMYAPFVKDWLALFPDMKIYRTEDYHSNRIDVYEKMLRFIGLELKLDKMMTSDHIVNKGEKASSAMLPKTRLLLDNFYRPFNQQLAILLKDDRFLFQ